MRRASLLIFLAYFALSAFGVAQTVPRRDPQAALVATRSLAALTGTTTLADMTLQGSVAYSAGSDEDTGTVTLLASGNLASNLSLNLIGGPRNEIRNGPAGVWSGTDGVQYAMALHNCWPDAGWFYPGLSFAALATDTGLGLAYIGPEAKNGFSVIHIQLFRVVSNAPQDFTAAVQTLSTEDLYVDASSALPLFLDYNVHPDSDYNHSIPVEIAFSGYQPMGGISVPSRVQKYFNGTLLLDLSIASAAINSGLPASDFNVTIQTASNRPMGGRKPSPGAAAPVEARPGDRDGHDSKSAPSASKASGGAR
jgi:hypothetical protein